MQSTIRRTDIPRKGASIRTVGASELPTSESVFEPSLDDLGSMKDFLVLMNTRQRERQLGRSATLASLLLDPSAIADINEVATDFEVVHQTIKPLPDKKPERISCEELGLDSSSPFASILMEYFHIDQATFEALSIVHEGPSVTISGPGIEPGTKIDITDLYSQAVLMEKHSELLHFINTVSLLTEKIKNFANIGKTIDPERRKRCGSEINRALVEIFAALRHHKHKPDEIKIFLVNYLKSILPASLEGIVNTEIPNSYVGIIQEINAHSLMEHFSIIDNLTIRLGTTEEDLKGGDTIIHCGAQEIWIDWKSDIIKHINSKLRLPNESLEETKVRIGYQETVIDLPRHTGLPPMQLRVQSINRSSIRGSVSAKRIATICLEVKHKTVINQFINWRYLITEESLRSIAQGLGLSICTG